MITIYSKPACVQCTATTREFDRRGIAYEYVDLTKDIPAMKKVREMGYMTAPVVITEDDHWGGFRPDKIAQLTADLLETA